MDISDKLAVTDYDQVREICCLFFISTKGEPTKIWVHRDTFVKLMKPNWQETLGTITTQQDDMRKAVQKHLPGDPTKWLDGAINEIMIARARSQRTEVS